MSMPDVGGVMGRHVTVVPWYDRADFAEICMASGKRHDYDRWRVQAARAIGVLLREGQAIEIVTVHPADYRAWLALHTHADSQASRERFVRELVRG